MVAASGGVVPIRTLYSLESQLNCLIESAEGVTPENEAEYIAELGAALRNAKDKRDDVGRFMAHLESQDELAGSEIARLQTRRASIKNTLDRLKRYVVAVMEAEGIKKLEGHTITFTTRRCPVSVEITDEAAVPLLFKTASITLHAAKAEELLDAMPVGTVFHLELAIDKTYLKTQLEAGHEYAGARLIADKRSLVRK